MPLSRLQLRTTILGLLLILTAVLGVDVFAKDGLLAAVGETQSAGLLTVVFLDVGQGDAIYIETPDGVQLLIDGGPDGSVVRALPKFMSLFDRKIDVVLATHSDKDHIGGLTDVLERYVVENIVRTKNTNDTSVAGVFATLESEENAAIQYAAAGQEFLLGASTTLSILFPASNPEGWESNSASIVAQLNYGEISFMLTGDAPVGIEEYLAESYGPLLESEVLKLGHHGSRTSTADSFLAAVDPIYAVVSAGKNNSYGHPHESVLAKVQAQGVDILSTASAGTVVFKSDGEKVWVEE